MKYIRKPRTAISILLTASLLSACSTIHKRSNLNGVDSLSIDAKQRVILVNDKGGMGQDRKITCAEPSPDALVAQAAALSGNINTPSKLSAALGAASNEAAGSIGLRTQTIQILRDGYFRLCEAYMNGAIGINEYKAALYSIDGVIAVTLAIDTLGGTAQAPAIALTPGNATTSAKGDGATADATAGSIVIENLPPSANDTLSPEQAKAIETITIHYLHHVKERLINADLY